MMYETVTYQNQPVSVRLFNNTDRVIAPAQTGGWSLGTLENDHTGREFFCVEHVCAHESQAVAWAMGRLNLRGSDLVFETGEVCA